jgi:hypothetical protein
MRWKMKKDLAVRKNLDLLNEFMKYAFENPKVLEEIPPKAELIILPIDAPELYEYNKKAADKMMSKGGKIVFVEMKKPEMPFPELMSTLP